jgi:serine/threonine protein kinase
MLRLNPIFRPSLRVVLEELTWVGGINWHESVVFEPTCSFGFGSKVLNLPSPTDGFSREETTQVVRLVSLLVEMVTDRKKEFPFGSIAAASAVTASVVRALGNTAIAPCCEGCAHNLVVLVIEIATMLIFDYVDFVIDPVLSKKRECVCDHEISFSHKLTTVIAETCKMPDCFAHPFFKMRVQAADGRWELAKQITVCDDEIVCVMAELAKINNTLYLFAPKMTKISIENAHEWINDHHENIIGRGVYGTVFSLNDDTAAKLIDLEDKLDFCFLLREIAAGNITTFGSEWCKTHEFHIFDDGAVLEMKKHDMSLENKKIKGVLVQKFIVEICEQALTMLVSGMASLDIKPNNVLFDKKNESFHMCDFGINNTVLGVAQPKLCGALWFRTVESIAAEINGNKWTRPNVELIEAGIVWQIGVTALTLLLGVNPMSIRSKGAVVKKDKFGNETFVSFLERLSVFCDEPFMPMSAMLNYETLPENVGILISEINKNVKNPVNVSGKMGAMITKMLRLNPLHRPSLREIVEEMAGDGDHTVVVHRPSSRVLGSKVLNLPPPPKASPQAKLLTLMLCDSVKKFKHLLPFGAIAVTSTVLTQLVHDFQIENLNECCAQKLCGKTLEIVEMLLCDLNYFYDTKGCFMCKCAFKIPQDAVIRLACKLPDCFSHTFFKQKVMKARGEWGIVNTLGVQENEICCVRNEVNNTIYLFFKICSTMFFPCFT